MSICTRCQQSYEPETITWARNKITGEEAQGRDPNIDSRFSPWYGESVYWLQADVEEYEQDVSRGTCSECDMRIYEAINASAELTALNPPSWFDPADCGESWDEI